MTKQQTNNSSCFFYSAGDVIRACGNCQRRKFGFCPKHEKLGKCLTNG